MQFLKLRCGPNKLSLVLSSDTSLKKKMIMNNKNKTIRGIQIRGGAEEEEKEETATHREKAVDNACLLE